MQRTRIMYIENKTAGAPGMAVIGRVTFSKAGKTLQYNGMTFQSEKSARAAKVKANYMDVDSGDYYWIYGPRKDQKDRLGGGNQGVTVDDDVAAEYAALIAG